MQVTDSFKPYQYTSPTADSVRLRKPLIVVEGYDPAVHNNPLFTLPTNPPFTFLNIRENMDIFNFIGLDRNNTFIGGIERANQLGFNLNEELDSASYDLIYVDYVSGTDDITRNAKMFEDVLRWVNARKVANAAGVREQNVVIGLSMGGLVARYGLAEMEKNRRAGVANNNHEVRMLITHDSPHRGANVPLALQSLVETVRWVTWGVKILPHYNAVFGEVIDLLNNKANSQMAIYSTVPIGPVLGNIYYKKNTWLEDTYRPMITFPANNPAPYQFIALSNGSECGTRHAPPMTELMKINAAGFIRPIPWLLKNKIKTVATMRGLPDRQARRIYDFNVSYSISFFGGLIEIDMNLASIKGNSSEEMLPIDGMAGGTESVGLFSANFSTPWWLVLSPGFEIATSRVENYCFIPKYSALDIRPDVPVDEIVANRFHATQTPSRSTADRIFTAPSTPNGGVGGTAGSEFNQHHILFTNRSAQFIFSQMEPTNINATLPIMDCSTAICNPNTLQIQSSLPSLCFGATPPNIFSISNLPTPAVVNWRVDNSNLVSIATPNSPTTIIKPNSETARGWVTITANITSVACNGFARVINRRIWVGEMTPISQINSNAVYDNCLTFQETYSLPANQAQGSQNIRWFISRNGSTAREILSAANRRQCSVGINVMPGSCEQVEITVTADNGCSNSSFSESFEYCLEAGRPRCTPTTGGRQAMLTFSVFPNPSSGKLTLSFENLWQKVVNLSVINSLGTQVAHLVNPVLSPLDTKHQTTLDLSTLPDGVYLITVMLENGTTLTQKVVLQKGVIAN